MTGGPPAPASVDAKQTAPRQHTAVGALVVVLMVLGSSFLWLGIPTVWLFAVSMAYGKTTPSLTIYALLLVGIPVTMALFGQQLARLNDVYERQTGRTSDVRVAAPWHRSTRGERDGVTHSSMLGVVMLVSVAIALAGLGVWFLFFASGGGI